jgi:hypothetical protein
MHSNFQVVVIIFLNSSAGIRRSFSSHSLLSIPFSQEGLQQTVKRIGYRSPELPPVSSVTLLLSRTVSLKCPT